MTERQENAEPYVSSVDPPLFIHMYAEETSIYAEETILCARTVRRWQQIRAPMHFFFRKRLTNLPASSIIIAAFL